MASASSDPDNIIADAKIEYELKSLVVMGQCYDVVDSRPPNGLQIQLEGTQSDTLVMQNLGYFQPRSVSCISPFRGAAAPSRRRRASSPGEKALGGLFVDFGAVRTVSVRAGSVRHRAPGRLN